jgi:adenylate kinase
MLGRQGAGKGTQAVRLSRHYVVPHISTGDMLRSAVKLGTEFGLKAQEIMDAGELVPDDIMAGIVEERLALDDTRNRGFVLDGFPRTVRQAELLHEMTQPKGIDLAVDLEVPTEIVLARLASRRVCVDCGANYSTDTPPKENWTCDTCGGEVIQRPDDTEEAITRRLQIYEQETAPLVAWFLERDMLVIVDGTGHPDTVTTRLVRAIDTRRQPS